MRLLVPFPQTTRRIVRSKGAAVILLALWLLGVPVFAQDKPQDQPLTNRLLERAERGHPQEQLDVARAFQLGLGVDRDLAEAARWFHKAANQGNPQAQCQLGFLYHMGSGVQRDDSEAFKWFQRAALENYAPAQFDLSLLLLQGSGASRDIPEAVYWMRRAAQQGFPKAETNLAIIYLNGLGVPANQAEGLRWLHKAAKRHYAPAEFLLGTVYQNPQAAGFAQNPAQAVYWYRKAANQRYALAQNNLGVLYEKGIGVQADTEEARKWYRLAAEQGDGSAADNLARSYAELHDAQNAKPDLPSAYFWALLALHYPPLHSKPLPTSFVAGLRARLSPEDASRIEAEVEDWVQAHPLDRDAIREDWFTFSFPESNAVTPQ